jgi:hypothetical protein
MQWTISTGPLLRESSVLIRRLLVPLATHGSRARTHHTHTYTHARKQTHVRICCVLSVPDLSSDSPRVATSLFSDSYFSASPTPSPQPPRPTYTTRLPSPAKRYDLFGDHGNFYPLFSPAPSPFFASSLPGIDLAVDQLREESMLDQEQK